MCIAGVKRGSAEKDYAYSAEPFMITASVSYSLLLNIMTHSDDEAQPRNAARCCCVAAAVQVNDFPLSEPDVESSCTREE